jgi:hypothetical protein
MGYCGNFRGGLGWTSIHWLHKFTLTDPGYGHVMTTLIPLGEYAPTGGESNSELRHRRASFLVTRGSSRPDHHEIFLMKRQQHASLNL